MQTIITQRISFESEIINMSLNVSSDIYDASAVTWAQHKET
jgi:hypothetical protein